MLLHVCTTDNQHKSAGRKWLVSRAVLNGKKSVPLHSFPKKARCSTMVGGGWWRLVAVGGGWWRLAVGGPLGRSLTKKQSASLRTALLVSGLKDHRYLSKKK